MGDGTSVRTDIPISDCGCPKNPPSFTTAAVDGGIAAVLPLRLTAGCMVNALRKEQQRFFV